MSDDKILEVAGVITAGYVRRGVPDHMRDDVYQDAALWALETRARYGHKMEGNAFSYLAMAAGVRVKRAMERTRAVVTISDHVADRRDGKSADDYAERVSLLKTKGRHDHRNRDEEFLGTEERPEVALSGEMDRLRSAVALFRRLDRRERRLVVAAMDVGAEDLDALAKRSKVGRARAVRVLRRFVTAVGDDPAVANLRRVISAA